MKKSWKYLKYPLEIFLFLLVFVALVYFRNVIFHTNVTHPVDLAMSFIGDKIDVDIPVYVSKSRNSYMNMEVTGTDTVKSDVIDTSNTPLVEEQISQEPVLEVIEAGSDEPVIMEPELVVGSSTTEQVEAVDPLMDTVDTVESEITSIDKEEISQDSQVTDDISTNNAEMISEITRTLESINQKVDDLSSAQDALIMSQKSSTVAEMKPSQVNNGSVDSGNNDTAALNEITIDSAGSTEKMKTLARQSFWNGNSFLSEKFYLGLMKYEDSDPDIYGELGNVYYAQGKWKQAGEAYYEAAIRLLDLKQNDQVVYLLRVIQGLDTESADKLKQKMSG